jgi:hypothetical protein
MVRGFIIIRQRICRASECTASSSLKIVKCFAIFHFCCRYEAASSAACATEYGVSQTGMNAEDEFNCERAAVAMVPVSIEDSQPHPFFVMSSFSIRKLATPLSCSLFAAASDDDSELLPLPVPPLSYTLVHPVARLWSTCHDDGFCNCKSVFGGTLQQVQQYQDICNQVTAAMTQAPVFFDSRFECHGAHCSIPFRSPMVALASLGCSMHSYYAYVRDGPSLPRLEILCASEMEGSCLCRVAAEFPVAGIYRIALQLLAAGATDEQDADEHGHFFPVRFMVAPQEVELHVINEIQQQRLLLPASRCVCDIHCTHTGFWKQESMLEFEGKAPSPARTTSAAADGDTIGGGSHSTCDDGRGMKWVNTCENSCCSPRIPPNATCLQRANTSLLVLGFSHERTLWFDMMYRVTCRTVPPDCDDFVRYSAVPALMLANPFNSTVTSPFYSAFLSFNYNFSYFCGGNPAAARCVPPHAILTPMMQAARTLVNSAPRDKACVMVVGLLSHLSMFQTLRDANETIHSALHLLQSLPCRILLRTAELPRPYDLKNGVAAPPQQHSQYEKLWGRGKLRLGLKRSVRLNEMARKAAAAAGADVVEGDAFTAAALHLNSDSLHPYCKVAVAIAQLQNSEM